jgi:DNA-binding MarR family transcriptional regulator
MNKSEIYLTPGELFILHVMADKHEMTSKEISKITKMKEGTVNNTLRSLVCKQKVKKLYRLVETSPKPFYCEERS